LAEAAEADCEYIVVGSGAGGGTVAARLAEAGHSVIVLEAGGDPRMLKGGDAVSADTNRLPADYDVPSFHAFASENEAMRWDFFVRHYSDDAQQKRDPKYVAEYGGKPVDGVLYPRAGTLGGCTAHNAMIFVYPNDEDWNGIADLMQDASWRADRMREHFVKMENCHHRGPFRLAAKFGFNPTRHGFDGWLSTESAIPMVSRDNRDLLESIAESAWAAIRDIGDVPERVRWLAEGMLDPNDWRTDRANSFGIRYLPLTTDRHARVGSRERLLAVSASHPKMLRLELNALATRILFDASGRAIGVEYLSGERLYRADPRAAEGGEMRRLYASREVILAGGAFNSPQLLMLSGIGPREELERHGIEVRVDLAGVGRNLQDRYEISVVNRMKFDRWHIYEGAKFDTSDPQYAEWEKNRKGPYITNAAVLSMYKRSTPQAPLPDVFCVAFLGKFKGYFPGYSKLFVEDLNYLTWAVLKAHTQNRAGRVMLRSSDPRDTPLIDFAYFEDGTPDADLDAVVDGIRFVRKLTASLKLIDEEELPGRDVQSDEELREYVRAQAWGHHASCSCAIGPRDQGGVLDSAFRVYGVRGLRVVDASVFPRIPGFFPVCAVYMLGEKAASVILSELEIV
jgi:choline dehydrogenase